MADAPGYDIALRPDHGETTLLDDIVVNNVEMFRAEAMGDGEWWVCCYLADGGRITWSVTAKCRPRRIEWTTSEYPDGEVTYEEGSVRG